jgi:hypothetical protein
VQVRQSARDSPCVFTLNIGSYEITCRESGNERGAGRCFLELDEGWYVRKKKKKKNCVLEFVRKKKGKEHHSLEP